MAVDLVCLASMGAQAALLWRTGVDRAGVLAFDGALFVASDALLATHRLAAPLPSASFWLLATYGSAQWCIAAWLPRRALDVGRGAR